MTNKSRYIPAGISKEVKKVSGFRCAWCGNYLTERHHIYPFSLGGSHSKDNLILLCPNCHTQANSGKISIDELQKRRLNLTGKIDRESGCLSINKEYFEIKVGGNFFVNCRNILVFNDIPLISMQNKNGYLLLSLKLFNKNGNLICWMSDNRWWLERNSLLDFRHTKDEFSITDKNNVKLIEVRITENLVDITGDIHLLGDIVQLSRERILFKGKQGGFTNCSFSGTNAIVFKEKSFNGLIPGGACVLMEI